MRVAIYARYSSDRQSDTSLKDQIRLCEARAKREGWTIVAIYEDAAASGALRMRRGYQTLLTEALSGKFEVVLAESLDRLNRDLEETARLYKRLKFVNVGIVTVSEGPISEVHVSISGLMGEMYLKSLGEKTRRGVEGRVLAGKSGGGRCLVMTLLASTPTASPSPGSARSMSLRRRLCVKYSAVSPEERGQGPLPGRSTTVAHRGLMAVLGAIRPFVDMQKKAPASSTTRRTSVGRAGVDSDSSKTRRPASAWRG